VYHNQMRTPLSSPCQLRLGVVLRCFSLSSYKSSFLLWFLRGRITLRGEGRRCIYKFTIIVMR